MKVNLLSIFLIVLMHAHSLAVFQPLQLCLGPLPECFLSQSEESAVLTGPQLLFPEKLLTLGQREVALELTPTVNLAQLTPLMHERNSVKHPQPLILDLSFYLLFIYQLELYSLLSSKICHECDDNNYTQATVFSVKT